MQGPFENYAYPWDHFLFHWQAQAPKPGNVQLTISCTRQVVIFTKLALLIYVSSFLRQMLVLQLTTLLSEVGLNIREAYVYSTKDNFCLDVFVVDGWETEVSFEHAHA